METIKKHNIAACSNEHCTAGATCLRRQLALHPERDTLIVELAPKSPNAQRCNMFIDIRKHPL